jgi:hypothetical protein
MLKTPLGFYEDHSRTELIYYAGCIYQDLRNCGGDPRSWWRNNRRLYQEYEYRGMRFVRRDGAMHFWKRLQSNFPVPMEVEVIDLTREDDIEIIDLTKDEESSNEDTEMAYEIEDTRGTEQDAEIIDLTKDYV